MEQDSCDDESSELFSQSREAYERQLPSLWPWVGWYVIFSGDQFLGVFATLAEATLASVKLEDYPAPLFMTKIGGTDAKAAPAADGGNG